MAGSVNKVILVGNLGADPEIRNTQDGREIANIRIATGESWKDKNTGERKQKTEWHRVVIFSPGLVTITKNYLKKGMKVYIEGALQTRKWQDQSGQERFSTEIVLQAFNSTLTMLDSRGGPGSANDDGYSGDDYAGASYGSAPSTNAAPAREIEYAGVVSTPAKNNDDFDDEVPF